MRDTNERNISVSYKQSLWLTSMGDRDVDDVYADEKRRLYILMWSSENEKDVKVYLPDDKYLQVKMLSDFHKTAEVIN